MSIEIDWEALTSGPDGLALAESIRQSIDAKLQQITLPRFIRSVQVLSFDFGAVGPDVEIKDICDPLPDFYEDDDDDDDEDDDGEHEHEQEHGPHIQHETIRATTPPQPELTQPHDGRERRAVPRPSYIDIRRGSVRSLFTGLDPTPTPLLGGTTPGIPGGTSNLSYFHAPLSAAFSGTATPLAAVAGRLPSVDHGSFSQAAPSTAPSDECGVSEPSPRSGQTRPPTHSPHEHPAGGEAAAPPRLRDRDVEHLQIVSRVRYSGDVKLSLTAEILLDYPMPSFVGIPLRLNITGLSFDGVAILAWIRHRAHFCFLSPEDAAASMLGGVEHDEEDAPQARARDGSDVGAAAGQHVGQRVNGRKKSARMGGLLQEIRVESEIGQRENGRQSLRNVGKVERFVLEQVRKIFDEELVYPSYWTFLI
ncbi:MAG: Mitochondrial distribution and morphology protein 12 [Phylliscum demangeonii]|nr:MAG: Mitochondrial distribution and morphology protein 12 [Phylliscum demangeonii]